MSPHRSPSHLRSLEGSHAVVIGASMAGLLAARALSEFFDRVTILERDRLPQGAEQRKGVPQGQHVHGLLKRGEHLIEEFFPGFGAAMLERGARALDFGADLSWHHCGVWKARFDSGVTGLCASRPLLEDEVRRRVLALPQVQLRDHCDVLGLLTAPGAVRGVRLRPRDPGGVEAALPAELVVDASGRGSATPRWLEELGCPGLEESQIKVQVGYASLVSQREDAHGAGRALYVVDAPPRTRLGIHLPMEPQDGRDRWMTTLGGMLGDYPPDNLTDFMDFARSLPVPDLYQELRGARPLGAITVYKFGANLRRHYERLPRQPAGLLVMGDAACSFNPFYGQGMTMAALGAQALRECLRAQPAAHQLPRRFQRALARATDAPWAMTTGEDLRFPAVEGRRAPGSGVMNAYLERLHRTAGHDTVVLGAFLRVMHLLASPASLLAPGIVLRVLLSAQP